MSRCIFNASGEPYVIVTNQAGFPLLVSNPSAKQHHSSWLLPVAFSPAHDTPLIITSVSLVRVISLARGESL